MPMFQKMLNEAKSYKLHHAGKNTAINNMVDAAPFEADFMILIRSVYERMFPGGSWVDKTPGGGVATMPLIQRAFPNAKIVATRRNGIEVVSSILKKFDTPFEQACRIWSTSMSRISQARSDGVQFLEVDQFDFTNNAADVACRLCAHLGRPEKTEAWIRLFQDDRIQHLSTHDWSKRLTLDDVRWTEQQKQTFVKICGKQMEISGYQSQLTCTVDAGAG